MISYLILLFLCSVICSGELVCKLDSELVKEIHGYQPIVDTIIKSVTKGDYKNKFYNDLADYVDTFPRRLSGTTELEEAIDNVLERQRNVGLETSVHRTLVPHWTRGEESAEIITPLRFKLTILGLGFSPNTTDEGVTAPVLVVKNFDELEAKKNEVAGKIVLFNADYTTYGETGQYRGRGPNEASRLGAVAALVKSITPFSIDSPHTGMTIFESEELRIPAAAVTLENANMIARLHAKGENVTINIKMSAVNHPPAESRNAIGDIVGASKPNEYVVISGHIDNWDVGQGAMDDADGAFLAWHSLAVIKSLKLEPPARTLRAIMWTSEEPGIYGADAYRVDREDEIRNWTVAFESDGGVFQSLGIGFFGSDDAACIMQEITSMLGEVNGTLLYQQEGAGSDIMSFADLGVPLGEPNLAKNNYFWYHHSHGDTMDVLTSEDLDQNLAIFASTIYVLANLSDPLPKQTESNILSDKCQDF